MKTNHNSSSIFWDRLLAATDLIDHKDVTSDEAIASLLAIDEGFSAQFDPADQYPEYVAIMLCRALRHRIEITDRGVTGS